MGKEELYLLLVGVQIKTDVVDISQSLHKKIKNRIAIKFTYIIPRLLFKDLYILPQRCY